MGVLCGGGNRIREVEVGTGTTTGKGFTDQTFLIVKILVDKEISGQYSLVRKYVPKIWSRKVKKITICITLLVCC